MTFEYLLAAALNRLSPSKRAAVSVPAEDGLLLGDASGAAEVIMPNRRRTEHMAIFGKSGSGKTTFFLSLMRQQMLRGEGFVFFDFHGDATNDVLRLAAAIENANKKLTLIDLSDESFSPGINPLEAPIGNMGLSSHTAELAAILRQRWGMDSFGARTEELLRNSLRALSEGGLTLMELPAFLTSDAFRARVLQRVGDAESRYYWLERYARLSEPMKSTFREPLLNKVTEFISETACRHLLGQSRSTIRFAEAIEASEWILVCLPKGQLRHHAQTIGNLICAQLLFAVLARSRVPEAKRKIFSIFCDEAQNLRENAETLVTLFAESRKFKCCLTTAAQFLDQLPRELRASMLAAGTLAVFRVSSQDATTLASELSPAGRPLDKHPANLGTGEAWMRVGPARPVLVSVRRPPTGAAWQDAQRLRRFALARHARARTEIEQEIRARRYSGSEHLPRETASAEGEGQHGW